MPASTGDARAPIVRLSFACLVVMSLAGCARGPGPGLLINESGTTLTVSVSMPRAGSPDRLANCRLDIGVDPLVTGSVGQAYDEEFRSWVAVILFDYDPDRCEATFAVPPGQAVLMFSGNPDNGSDPQLLGRLDITGEGRSFHLNASEANAAFESSFWHRSRRFVVE